MEKLNPGEFKPDPVNDFSEAKKGDMVYSLKYGKGQVADIYLCQKSGKIVKFPVLFLDLNSGETFDREYLSDGRRYWPEGGSEWCHDRRPELYRTKPKITAPPPKEKITKELFIVWVKHLSTDEIEYFSFDKENSSVGFINEISSLNLPYFLLDVQHVKKELLV